MANSGLRGTSPQYRVPDPVSIFSSLVSSSTLSLRWTGTSSLPGFAALDMASGMTLAASSAGVSGVTYAAGAVPKMDKNTLDGILSSGHAYAGTRDATSKQCSHRVSKIPENGLCSAAHFPRGVEDATPPAPLRLISLCRRSRLGPRPHCPELSLPHSPPAPQRALVR